MFSLGGNKNQNKKKEVLKGPKKNDSDKENDPVDLSTVTDGVGSLFAKENMANTKTINLQNNGMFAQNANNKPNVMANKPMGGNPFKFVGASKAD